MSSSEDRKSEYVSKSIGMNLPPRCPLLKNCRRRAQTMCLLNNWPLEKADFYGELQEPKIDPIGDPPYKSGSNEICIHGNLCPEVSLFEPKISLAPGWPATKISYDKYSNPTDRIETGHYSQCAEYSDWQAGLSKTQTSGPAEAEMPKAQHVILLIHGIRTNSTWQNMVKRVLEEESKNKVQKSNYGYFDVVRFWLPFTRRAAIEEVKETIQEIKDIHGGGVKLSIIAHSNGTYIISKLLKSERDLRIHTLILCGSIIKRRYPWHQVSGRVKFIINDFGTKDHWPVLAKSCSWGYGDTGRHPFRKPRVIDRGHPFNHGDFFRNEGGKGEDFVRKYWKPLLEEERIVEEGYIEDSPYWLKLLSILPIQWIVTTIGVVTLILLTHTYSNIKIANAIQISSEPIGTGQNPSRRVPPAIADVQIAPPPPPGAAEVFNETGVGEGNIDAQIAQSNLTKSASLSQNSSNRLETAKAHPKPGYVFSPYQPDQAFQVPKNMSPGDTVLCPYSGKPCKLPEDFLKWQKSVLQPLK